MKEFNLNFFKYRKIYIYIMAAIFAVGIIFSIIFGVDMSIEFTGGTILKYSYTGTVAEDDILKAVKDQTGFDAEIRTDENVVVAGQSETVNTITLTFAKQEKLLANDTKVLSEKLSATYSENKFLNIDANSVDASMGGVFFLKCIVAVILAALLIILYVGIRFRKIGGVTASIMAVGALILDILVVFFVFVFFGFALDENFIAVVLTIFGYSVNDTIVIFDRIRENRRLMGPKAELEDVITKSMNQTLMRCIITAAATFVSIACVVVMAFVYKIDSILTFAVPMMFGIVGGYFSTVYFAPLNWAVWKRKLAEKKEAKK